MTDTRDPQVIIVERKLPEVRLLNKARAAAYCGLDPTSFMRLCPVPPEMSRGKERYWNRAAIDTWIDGLSGITREEPQLDSFIYFVGFGAYVKIGFSGKDFHRRLANLQVGCPEPLTVYALIRGTREQEAELQRRFDEYRTIGEWFHLSDAIKSFIASRKK